MKELQKAVAAVSPIAVRFAVGDVVRHRLLSFRGVVFDVDPEFANSEEWWESIPEAVRPAKEQPFYHLLAENEENSYVAYVSQQNLEHDDSDVPVHHPAIDQLFNAFRSEEHTSELQSLMRISYAVFCLTQKTKPHIHMHISD